MAAVCRRWRTLATEGGATIPPAPPDARHSRRGRLPPYPPRALTVREDAPTLRREHLHASPPPHASRVNLEAATLDDAGHATRYRVGDLLGEGGMGEVRACRDRRVGREIAMKVVRPVHGGDQAMRERFLREARVQGQLEHPCIVPVYDIGLGADGATYFTMKRVRGHTLESVLDALRAGDEDARKRWSRRRILADLSTVCGAVAYAHARGVGHRDLKPANVMLGDFVPSAFVLGVRDWVPLAFTALFIAAAGALSGWFARGGRFRVGGQYALMALTVLGIVSSSRLFGPFMMVPAAIVACAAPFAMMPDRSRRLVFLAIGVAGMLVPALADVSGLVAPSYVFRDNTMVLTPQMTDLPPTLTFLGILVIHLATLVTSTRLFWRIRDAFADASQRLHVFAWQLRQIVPDGAR